MSEIKAKFKALWDSRPWWKEPRSDKEIAEYYFNQGAAFGRGKPDATAWVVKEIETDRYAGPDGYYVDDILYAKSYANQKDAEDDIEEAKGHPGCGDEKSVKIEIREVGE